MNLLSKKLKSILLIFILVITTVLVAGCGEDGQEPKTISKTPEELSDAKIEPDGVFKVTMVVVDDNGAAIYGNYLGKRKTSNNIAEWFLDSVATNVFYDTSEMDDDGIISVKNTTISFNNELITGISPFVVSVTNENKEYELKIEEDMEFNCILRDDIIILLLDGYIDFK